MRHRRGGSPAARLLSGQPRQRPVWWVGAEGGVHTRGPGPRPRALRRARAAQRQRCGRAAAPGVAVLAPGQRERGRALVPDRHRRARTTGADLVGRALSSAAPRQHSRRPVAQFTRRPRARICDRWTLRIAFRSGAHAPHARNRRHRACATRRTGRLTAISGAFGPHGCPNSWACGDRDRNSRRDGRPIGPAAHVTAVPVAPQALGDAHRCALSLERRLPLVALAI